MKEEGSFQQGLEDLRSNRLLRQLGFVRIPTALLVHRIDLGMPRLPAIQIFADTSVPGTKMLRDRDQPYSALAIAAHTYVWIRENDTRALVEFAEAQALSAGSISDPSQPALRRAEELRQNAMRVIDDLFDDPSPRNLHRSSLVVAAFVHLLMKDPQAYLLLSRLSSHDPYTLQHSVGTSISCIMVGRKLGITDEDELQELGLAGLLHDIGKVSVPRDIVHKETPLDEAEWLEMRKHCEKGWIILKDNPDIGDRVKRVVLEHHEDQNGTGYPQGLGPNQVHLFSKIVCVCDAFNALTTDGRSEKARTPFEAFQFMRDKLAHKFDDEVFRQLVLIHGGNVG